MSNDRTESRSARLDRLAATAVQTDGSGPLRAVLARLTRDPAALVGATIVAIFLLAAVFAPLLSPHDPVSRFPELTENLAADRIPGARPGFPLGSDPLGRDFLSRLIHGSRQTLVVGVVATVLGVVAGVVLGVLAGAAGGWTDTAVMRLTDVLLAIPGLLLAITLVAVTARPSQWTVCVAVALVNVPVFTRLLRGSMLAQRERDHVLAARALGARQRSIMARHILPNSLAPVLVQATLTFATAIVDAAALSFLGLGDPDINRCEWGRMLGVDGVRYFEIRPELAYYPAVAIIVVALGFTVLGESLREALDPRNRR